MNSGHKSVRSSKLISRLLKNQVLNISLNLTLDSFESNISQEQRENISLTASFDCATHCHTLHREVGPNCTLQYTNKK